LVFKDYYCAFQYISKHLYYSTDFNLMRKASKLLLLSFVLLISISAMMFSSSAVPELLVDVQAIDSKIQSNEVAQYQIEFTNNKEEIMELNLPTPQNNWDITIRPYMLTLKPAESKVVDIFIAPPKVIKSGVYSIFFKFTEENQQIDYKYLHVDILENSPVIEAKVNLIEEVEVQEYWSEKFLEKGYSVTIINKGNTEAIGDWPVDINSIDSFFISTEPDAVITSEDGSTNLIWSYSVPVGEEVTYKYDISYVPLAAALVLIALALIMLGFYYSTPYKLVKSVTVQKKGKEKFIGIQLALKNKTGKKQKNIMIEDYVPIPLVVSREFGTMSPTAIRKQKDKLALTWKFDELQPREERMLSYKMKSKLEVDGKIGIPAANVTQKVGKKKIQIFSKILRA
jgi:hypothetical protein